MVRQFTARGGVLLRPQAGAAEYPRTFLALVTTAHAVHATGRAVLVVPAAFTSGDFFFPSLRFTHLHSRGVVCFTSECCQFIRDGLNTPEQVVDSFFVTHHLPFLGYSVSR